jgi:hypothetical protein
VRDGRSVAGEHASGIRCSCGPPIYPLFIGVATMAARALPAGDRNTVIGCRALAQVVPRCRPPRS